MTTTIARLILILGMCVIVVAADAAPLPSDSYQVQEDYKLQLDTPNLVKNTPQFVTCFNIDSDTFIVVTFNFRDQPVHDPGGIQIQLWDQGNLVDTVDVTLNSLNVSGDTVTWTQKYKINQGKLEMSIVGIGSQAWGQINNTASIFQDPAHLSTFNTYDPAESVAESHINYGRNAVTWFGMTECRKYDDKGKKIWIDSTPKVIFSR